MPVIDMSTLKAVGEFGSKAWGEACAAASVRILQTADIPADTNWAFTENYTHPPERLLSGGREKAGYFIMVKNGQVTADDGVPDEARALPGFHAQAPWAYFCNQSAALYGREGQQRRSADENVLMAAIVEYTGNANPFNFGTNSKGETGYFLDPIGPWPAAVGASVGEGGEEGNGLHNIAATLQSDSPEFADLPVTEMRVPIFADMTEAQKKFYLELCGVS